jgi:hypothetical protein
MAEMGTSKLKGVSRERSGVMQRKNTVLRVQ